MHEVADVTNWSRRGTLGHARHMLGLYLVRSKDGVVHARMITDVEAYDGERDQACHARFGRTPRSEMLYRQGGIWYVYLCYGVHEMLNLVVGPADWPAAVLIRGVDDISGPGRVTKAMQVNRALNGATMSQQSGLWLEDRGIVIPPRLIKRLPRVGINYAGVEWAAKPWRFMFDPRALPKSVSGLAPR
ncbi:MAG: DNA-3-methyladenine glycosylase [Opitutaceae bacterium]|nr:DNA-3-methyladenine glycosylase [Opitutaceae bacterium]